MRSRKHCIVGHMIESYSDAFHTKRRKRLSKKLMTACAEHTSLDLSSEIGLEDLATTGRKWSLTPLPMLSDAMPVKSMVISSIKHWTSLSYVLFMNIWYVDYQTHQPLTSTRHRFILGITDYFSKWAEVVPLMEVKTSNVLKFIKHHMLYRLGAPQQIVHYYEPQFVS